MATETAPLDPQTQQLVFQASKGSLLDAMHAHPAIRPKLLALVKEFKPDAQIPAVDIPAQVHESVVKPALARIDAMETRLTKREAMLDERASEQDLVDSGQVSRTELPEIKKLMTDKGIASLPTAIEHYRLQAAAAPRPAPSLMLPTKDLKGLFQDPRGWARREAAAAIAETRR